MIKNKILSVAFIGCGARGQMYSELAAEMKDKFRIVAAADPVKERVERIKELSNPDDFKTFNSAEELFAHPRLADILVISTQDSSHFENCKKAIELGYDILLEKPVATQPNEIFELEKYAQGKKSRVMVCYVLRFNPAYIKVKEIISSGMLGDIVSMNYVCGVSPWRMAHSFVRGHWAVMEESAPTILAKACHDTDMIQWLLGRKCLSLSSYGALNHFTPANAPKGAPIHCVEGCEAAEWCIYNALRYAGDKKQPWLPQIYDKTGTAGKEEILEWLKTSPWGRCVYRCGNNALDHQVVSMLFEENITCTFTMTAFETGRHIEIYGTKGVLKGGAAYRDLFKSEITFIPYNGEVKTFNVTGKMDSVRLRHERDKRLIEKLYSEMVKPAGEEINSSLSDSIQSHIIAFAAEKARLNNCVVNIDEFQNQCK
jgi:predicted dehydrogenase